MAFERVCFVKLWVTANISGTGAFEKGQTFFLRQPAWMGGYSNLAPEQPMKLGLSSRVTVVKLGYCLHLSYCCFQHVERVTGCQLVTCVCYCFFPIANCQGQVVWMLHLRVLHQRSNLIAFHSTAAPFVVLLV